ncbi:MAG: DNA mismatch repair endonuclease MutL [Bacteroidia bacterium]
MKQLIQLLPDNIANQIAAGEVVQRPASVVKELLENSVDAGATRIELIIKDAGKALVQVIDNGCGMSALDARMSFERHATSKIRKSEDLFNIRTMGFRGEAMASIAAVAQVQMRSRLHDEELGNEIVIEGSEIKRMEPCLCPKGTTILVKNLFFNVPARRNFLKTNPVEIRHILNEFIRVAMAQPEVAMRLDNQGTIVYDLPAAGLEDRLIALMGKDYKGQLIPVGELTPYVGIQGFIAQPEACRHKKGEQFFFVNRRFIKSPYLHHAIQRAYEGLLPADTQAFYCIFFDIAPEHVDINIHPTKTEIKFDDERTVYQLLHSVVRKGIGQYHQAPMVEMDEDQGLMRLISQIPLPPVESRPEVIGNKGGSSTQGGGLGKPRTNPAAKWGDLYPGGWSESQQNTKREAIPNFLFPEEAKPVERQPEVPATQSRQNEGYRLGNRYVVTHSQDGLIVIDQVHAHQRILYEKLRRAGGKAPLASQQLLFPRTLTFTPLDFSFVREVQDEIRSMGFDIHEFGPNTFLLQGVPAELKGSKAEKLFEEIISEVREGGGLDVKERVHDRLARTIAIRSAMNPGHELDPIEMRTLIDQLFACEQPGHSPGGKPTYYRLTLRDLEQFFLRNA